MLSRELPLPARLPARAALEARRTVVSRGAGGPCPAPGLGVTGLRQRTPARPFPTCSLQGALTRWLQGFNTPISSRACAGQDVVNKLLSAPEESSSVSGKGIEYLDLIGFKKVVWANGRLNAALNGVLGRGGQIPAFYREVLP